jgi:hypothetical protein
VVKFCQRHPVLGGNIMNSCASILALFLVALLTLIPAYSVSSPVGNVPPGPTAVVFPTLASIPTATLDPAALDMSRASVYKSPDGAIEILLPPIWQIEPAYLPGQYLFAYGPEYKELIVIDIAVGKPNDIYLPILELATPVDSPKAALEAYKAWVSASGSDTTLKLSNVEPVKIGRLDGYGLSVSAPADPTLAYEFRIAPLTDGRIVFVLLELRPSMLDTAKPVLYKMLDSLVINPEYIPTLTPTPTLGTK